MFYGRKHLHLPSPCPDGLSIMRDDAGVPHIQGNSLSDLAWGIGYCHVKDRATQLQMLRIIGQGRLCELLDDSEDNLKIDSFFRRMNWQACERTELDRISGETREWCQAYCDGINTAFANKKLSILKALGYSPEPWQVSDILLVLRMTSYVTLAQSQAEIERLFVELAQTEISSEKLAALFPVDPKTLDRELISKIKLEERMIPMELLWEKGIPRAMASNNWVISGKKTASGLPILANDPHLEVNRLPNVWYEMTLSCPDYQGMGYGMPGLPALLIGRTPEISWGATYTFMDTVDSWVEHCKNGKFRRGKSWRPFNVRTEVIKRKKHADLELSFFENAHGTLEGSPEEEAYLLSTNWAPAKAGARSLNACFELAKARNTTEAMQALGKVESAWNWVIADHQGNIGYQMSGLCPKRSKHWNGFAPAPGWDKEFDWQGFEAPEDLPRAYNPEEGYIVTANEDLNHLGKSSPINMPMGDYRSQRIKARLNETNTHTFDHSREIQMDVFSLQAKAFVDVLRPMIKTLRSGGPAANILETWNYEYDENSLGASLFEDFYTELRVIVFGDQQFGTKAIEHLSRQSCLFADFYQNFDQCLLNENSPWYDHVTQQEAFTRALERACEKHTGQTWGERNRFRFQHILFQGKLPAWTGFDSAECAMIGGRATPHQGQIYESGGRLTSFAPSVRMIADMAEAMLHTRTAGGVSDNRLSPWYCSEIDGWLEGSLKQLKP